jgi:hypothetical protein
MPGSVAALPGRRAARAMGVGARSAGKFGLTGEQWETAVEEVREAILDAAYDRR